MPILDATNRFREYIIFIHSLIKVVLKQRITLGIVWQLQGGGRPITLLNVMSRTLKCTNSSLTM